MAKKLKKSARASSAIQYYLSLSVTTRTAVARFLSLLTKEELLVTMDFCKQLKIKVVNPRKAKKA